MPENDPADVVIPFGKHKDKTIGEVASTDEGLRYLDWMVGIAKPGYFKNALESYLETPAISGEVDSVLADDDDLPY